jgi:hypothetical protein
MSLLGLPWVSVSTFLDGLAASPDLVQVGDSSGSHGALSSLQAPGSTLSRDLAFIFICAQEDFLL